MESGVASQLKISTNIHGCAYTPIHTFIAQIIPHLELRQKAARKYLSKPQWDDESEKAFTGLISRCNEKIDQILNINRSILP